MMMRLRTALWVGPNVGTFKRHFSTPSKDELAQLNEELKRQGAQLQRQEDLLTQLLIRLSPANRSDDVETKKQNAVKPPPSAKAPRAFLEFQRKAEAYRPAKERVRDWLEIARPGGHNDPLELKRQAARCMDCGTPFCQTNTGCPVNNLIPEWNELVLTDRWKDAIERLHLTNNFPEFTGRVCPAPCEGSCVAGVNDPSDAVTIKNIEYAIIDKAFKENWVLPRKVASELRAKGKSVAIIGSGPAGLAAGDILNQLGHQVSVFERADRIGGLLMYGIPTMKLAKETVERRVALLKAEGVNFVTNTEVKSEADLKGNFDAILIAVGACKPRDLVIPGRNLSGIHFAMDFLTQNQKDLVVDPKTGSLRNAWSNEVIPVKGSRVVVIGGGDTGTDCIGTSIRQFCKSVVNLELMPRPPEKRSIDNPWPLWPRIYRVDYGHAEATEVFGSDPRHFAVTTKRFVPDASKKAVKALVLAQVEFDSASKSYREVPNTEFEIQADAVILAMGFLGVEDHVANGFGLELDAKGNIQASFSDFRTSREGIFAAGDCRRGQSLVVWGIREGRDAAKSIHEYLSSVDQKIATG